MSKDKKVTSLGAAGDLFERRPNWTPFRNPDRIPHMINLLYAVWCLPDNRDLRMGQLLMNAAKLGGHGPSDIWNVEEEVFAKGFLAMIKAGQKEEKK